MKIVLIIVLTVLVVCSNFISHKGGAWIDNRFNGIKKITRKGWYIIGINVIVIITLIVQYFYDESVAEKREKVSNRKQEIRDSTLKVKYDKTNLNTVTTITEVLAKYGLKFDSANQSLAKIIKDSSKTKVIMPDYPVLSCVKIQFYKIIENRPYYLISLRSIDASCTGFNLVLYKLSLTSHKSYIYEGEQEILSFDDKISTMEERGLYAGTNLDTLQTMLYFELKGTYTNLDFTKTFPFDNTYFYNIKSKSWGDVQGDTRKLIIEYINYSLAEKKKQPI